jgi:uncharacterized membrane protein YeaQ/YmgE (transglycosylase-associated protein family)
MGIIVTILMGAVVGWFGSRLAGEPNNGCLTNTVIGIAGGMLGGAALSFATGEDHLFTTGAADVLLSFVASVAGAAVLILVLRALGRRS